MNIKKYNKNKIKIVVLKQHILTRTASCTFSQKVEETVTRLHLKCCFVPRLSGKMSQLEVILFITMNMSK